MATLFTGGSVFDGHRHLPGHDLLVEGGEVVAILDPDGLDGLDRRDQLDVVDLAGGLVSPGFTDAHCHPIQGGLERMQCDLTGGQHAGRLPRRWSASTPPRHDGPWITGGGWAMAAFPGGTPSAADLDTVVPDRPVLPPNRDHHGAWVNSRALELAGIYRGDTRSRGRTGRATSRTAARRARLHEGAMDAVARLLPELSPAEYAAGLVEGQRYLFSLGVTAWQDAIVGAYAGMADTGSTYVERPGRAATWSPTWSARSGGTASSGSGRSPTWSSAAGPSRGAGSARRASRSCRTASARTSPRRCSRRTSTCTATPPPTPGTPSSRPRS